MEYFAFYKPLFMVQLLVAGFLFCCRLPRRSLFWLRYTASAAACIALSVLIMWTPENALGLCAVFLAFFVVTLLAAFFCYEVPFGSLLMCMTCAYVMQHFAYCLSNCVLIICGLNSDIYGIYTDEVIIQEYFNILDVFGYIISFVIYYLTYWLFYLFFVRRIKRGVAPRLKNRSLLPVCVCALVLSIAINAVFVYAATDYYLILLMNLYNGACCLFIIYVMFSMLKKSDMQHELDSVTHMLACAEKQYEVSKKSVEMVNIKCHDLKQQIRTIGKAKLISEDAISEIYDAVSVYDSGMDTGNGPLDIILTEKSLACRKNGIKIECMADGSLLSFLTEGEIYSMFGNAIDNAARAVSEVQDAPRTIGLTVRKIKSFLTVQVRNRYSGEIKTGKNGLPVTTKSDAENHGLGLKSIRYIAEKYGGRMSVRTEGDMFYLNIIFPLKNNPRQ